MFDHSHHHHAHPKPDFSRAFAVGITLNVAFIIAEVIYGLHANSLALLADAGHNASDVLGLLLAWGAMLLARRQPSPRYTYGLQSSSILAALANAMLLLIAVGGIGLEAIQRFSNPQPVAEQTIIWVAAVGVLINAVTAMMFMRGHDDLNIRGAFLHMAADAGLSLGVVIAGVGMMKFGWLWLDPLTSLLIAVAIIAASWGLLRDSFNLALQAVPRNINIEEVKTYLASLNGVQEVHDLHIWAMSTSETALSAHLLMPSGHPGDAFIWDTVTALDKKFHISHATLQIEMGNGGEECRLTHAHEPATANAGHHHHHGHGCNHDHEH